MSSAQPLPCSIFFLTCLSLFLAICILVCSSFSHGLLSLWISPTVAVFAMAYHTILLVLAYKQPARASMFFVTSIACAYLLSLAWFASFIVMTFLAYEGLTELSLCGIMVYLPKHHFLCHKFEFLLTPFEAAIMGDLTVRLSIGRRDAWRSMECTGKGQEDHSGLSTDLAEDGS
ncbi:hypothetical protein Hypma_009991 [Hypsizygus marmoreus]|uniref:Uncharacterized protein n=1 Tax=Hypsizygus marmoreus TaxID=39966 RepID=A0A369JJZ9_HYPMA|nr:hypothetical protein Hypma_009991 [Hypsizygus marmoreus]